MRPFILSIVLFCGIGQGASAQGKWDLRTCVEYAMANNISVRQSDLQARISALTYKQSKLSLFPTLSIGTNAALNSGNNQDPVTFSRITETYLSSGMQLQTSADIFNFFSKRNQIAANEWELMAAKANVDKIKNDIALSTANAYLLRKILKGKWGFKGIVVSDWGSVGGVMRHGYAADEKEAAEKSVNAGCDMDMESRC